MRKLFSIIFTFCLILNLAFSQEKFSTEASLYKEIQSAFSAGLLPSVVEQVEAFNSKYPESVYSAELNYFQAQSFVELGQFSSAKPVLQTLLSQKSAKVDLESCHFLLGKVYFKLGNYQSALAQLYEGAKSPDKSVRIQSILFAGRIFYYQKNFELAETALKEVIENGNEVSYSDYCEALQKLLISCNENHNYSRTEELFNQLNEKDFDSVVFNSVRLQVADALEGQRKYAKAYELYCKVIESGERGLALSALKKAFVLSEEKKISTNPGEVFEKTEATFADSPEIVNEFWLRLGIDEFERGNLNQAKEYLLHVKDNPIALIYEAKIALKRADNREIEAAADVLAENEALLNMSKLEKISDSYYATLLSCYYALQKWNEIPEVYKKLQQPDGECKNIYAAYFYNKADYKGVLSVVSSGTLYASSLAKLGELSRAKQAYEKLDNAGELYAEDLIEYGKVLFLCGDFDFCKQKLLICSDADALYLTGLCDVNLKNWTAAKQSFVAYIVNCSNQKGFNPLALYFKGYCEYALQDYKNAFASLVRYGTEAPSNQGKYIYRAYEIAVAAAVSQGDYKGAVAQVENTIRYAPTEAQKQNAILKASLIYEEAGLYEQAAQSVLPYISDNSDFAAQALFRLSAVYDRSGDVNKAVQVLDDMTSRFSRSKNGETAMFRAGELFYSHQDYASALNRFNKYVYKYSSGSYIDQALFFAGDSALKIKDADKSVLFNTTLQKKYPDSVFSYGSLKNLLDAYSMQMEYSLALSTAVKLVQNFPEQSASEGIGRRLIELEKLVDGESEEIARKFGDYEEAGKYQTEKGRKIATEIIQMYAKNPATKAKAVELALQIYPLQAFDDESFAAAQNGEFLADYFRAEGNNKSAAELYLSAAQHYRSSSNDEERVAACLYSATDSFVAAQMPADAAQTASLLKQLYPKSRQAQNVDRLIQE